LPKTLCRRRLHEGWQLIPKNRRQGDFKKFS
jgi:hypothetical protein